MNEERKPVGPKVTVATAAVTIPVFTLGQFGIELTPEVAAAIATLLVFGTGYLKSE